MTLSRRQAGLTQLGVWIVALALVALVNSVGSLRTNWLSESTVLLLLILALVFHMGAWYFAVTCNSPQLRATAVAVGLGLLLGQLLLVVVCLQKGPV